MKTRREAQCRTRILAGLLAMILVLMMGIMAEPFGMISHAQSQGKVTASSAKIRKDPSASSEVVGSAKQDANVTINFQTSASDGTTWYQIFVDANTLGYIRSDLVQITDGSTPATQSVTTSTTTTATATPAPVATTAPVTNETPAEVTAVNPVAASVTGGQSVRVRSNASTSSQILTSVQSGLAVTVAGQATGTDGRVWYQVMFIANGSEVKGFIRSDYISLSEELTPLTEEGTEGGENAEEPEQVEEPVVSKTYETQEQSGVWYLINNDAGEQYEIAKLFASVESNYQLATEAQNSVKTQRIFIVLLVFLVIALAAAATYLFMKLRDRADAAYFSEVERETLNRRSGGSGSKSVMPTVGTGRGNGSRPSGSRPAGAPQGNRPAGSRPAGTASQQGNRPAGSAPQGGRPTGTAPQQGNRPAGTAPQGSRPAGNRPAQETPQGNRPAGSRPAQEAPQSNRPAGARPTQEAPQGSRPAGSRPTGAPAQGNRPTGNRPAENGRPQSQPNPGWKSKNFMNDDDEFEFEFLNWDGEEES